MKHENLRNNTEQMYNNTLEELRKRGDSEEKIAIVEAAKESALAAYDSVEVDDGNPYLSKHEILDMFSNIGNVTQNITPLMSNLFIVHIGDVPINLNRLLVVNHDKKTMTLSFYETKDFSPLNYFLKNKKFDKLEVEYLSPQGEKIRTDRFKHIKAKCFFSSYLSYTNDEPLITEITFKYSKYVSSAS